MSQANKTATDKTSRMVSGRVISNRMQKTVTVQVERRIQHPLYGKFVTRRSKLHAHDEAGACKPGDKVLIEACRPISKTKSWRVVRVLETARDV